MPTPQAFPLDLFSGADLLIYPDCEVVQWASEEAYVAYLEEGI